MKKRYNLYPFIIFACTCLLLTGCMGTPRVETIIMHEPEQESSDQEATPFTVETIYSILERKTESARPLAETLDIVYPFGWIDANSLLGFTFSYPSGKVQFGRINEPYTAEQKLYELNSIWQNIPLRSIALSPDRSYISYIDWIEDRPVVHLHSLEDGANTYLETAIDEHTFNAQMSWSDNSRFFSFPTNLKQGKSIQLNVYDNAEESIKSYIVDIHQKNEFISFAAVSDNGEEAVIVKRSDQNSVLEWGKLTDDAFTPHYRHPISNEGQVEWLHQDQIIFVGADETLYAYDQRNGLLSVLLNDVKRFRLSADRTLIAYTSRDESVYAGKIYGNNILNITQIYKGIDAHQMQWGPDNSKLLISGFKESPNQRPLDTGGLEPRSFDIFLRPIYFHNLVIELN